uniref:Apple domain-containing protein n=1 Tax=Parastrongyloides trichosuri TaxID=131310 RepID=A0A0N4ZNC4_PARTI
MSKVTTIYVPPKPIVKLIENVNSIFILSIAIALGYALFFVLPENSMSTYISEKGLMPGLVNEKFNYKEFGFKDRKKIKSLLHKSPTNNRSILIKDIIEDMGYRVDIQNYNYFIYTKNVSSTNVYSIVKCVRGPCTESMIIVVPLTTKYIDSQIIGMELLNYFNSLLNWSKNVIFLFTPDLIGTQAYLSSYYNQDHLNIQYDSLKFSSGDLIGGVVLNLSGDFYYKVNIQYNMINGRYPNLDWFNGIVRILEKFDLKPMIHTPDHKHIIKNIESLNYHGTNCIRSVLSQALLETQNLHSLFGLHCVSMVTLQSDFNDGNGHVSKNTMIEVIEASIRALNNLDEQMSKSGLHLVAYYYLLIASLFVASTIGSKLSGVPTCNKNTSPVFTLQHNSTNGILARSLPLPTLIDCSEHCSSSSDCIGVEYWQGICRVIGENKDSIFTPTDDTSIFLTKSCVKSDRICSSPFHFDVYDQKILVGFAREVVPAESIEICMAACLNAFDTYGFECESAMFYPVDNECILNTEDRLDRPDLFVNEKDDTVYYLDSNCAGSQCYAPYITQYIAVEGKQIENELDRKFEDVDFQNCEELCTGRITITQNDFTCKSFMYNPETRTCYLSDERSKPLGRAKLVESSGYTYYEKKCFASPRTCRQPASFTRVPQMILVGFAAFVMENVPSVTMCLDQCTNPPPETGDNFVCKSVMYYYNEQECILNAETRQTKPDLFIPEGEEFLVDYFDISCHLEPETCSKGTYLRGIKSINAALPEGEGSLHVIESAGKSIIECLTKCIELSPEKCRSFNYEKSTGLCNLLYLDGKTTLKPFVKNGFDLIDMQCLSTEKDCSAKKDGVATKREKVVGVSKCLDLCSEAERCDGVNYNRRTGECELFQTIDNVKDLKKSEHVDFYQNLCTTKENEAGVSSALNVPQPIVITIPTNNSKIDAFTEKNANKKANSQITIHEKENRFHPNPQDKDEKVLETATYKSTNDGSSDVNVPAVDSSVVQETKDVIPEIPAIPKTQEGPLPVPILIPADQVQTICDYEGIKVQIKSPQSFTGVIFVKNHYESCRVEVKNSDAATLELGLPASFGMKPITLTPTKPEGSNNAAAVVGDNSVLETKLEGKSYKTSSRARRDAPEKSCGITEIENGKYKSTVVVQTNNLGIPGLVTSTDQIYEIGCDYSSMLGGKITTAANMTVNGPTPTDIKPRGKIELGNPVLMQMNSGAGDHQPVLQAKLGDILELRWEIMAMDEELDFFVKDCIAEPGSGAAEGEKLQLIEAGCPTPAVAQKLIPQPIKVQTSAVKIAHLQAFRFDSSSSVRITCNIEICKGDCKPAKCTTNGEEKQSWGRKRRSLDNEVTEFETNRYKVPRYSQATTSLLILDPLQNSIEPASALSKISSLDLLAEDPAETLLKIKETAHLNGNLCMGKVTLFSVFGVLLTLIVIQAVVVTNYIFKRVMSSRKTIN